MIQGCVRIMPEVRICGSSCIKPIRLYVDVTLLMVLAGNQLDAQFLI